MLALVARRREKVQLAVGRRGDDPAIGRDHHRRDGKRQRDGPRCLCPVERPKADGGIVAGTDEGLPVRRESDAIDVLLVSLKDALRPARQGPEANRPIPRRRGDTGAVGRDRDRRNRT